MSTTHYFSLMLFILVYYLISILLINRSIAFTGLKKKELNEEAILKARPLLFASNINLIISLFIIVQPIINFITFQINTDDSILFLFGLSSIVLLCNVITLTISFAFSSVLSYFFNSEINLFLKPILWVVINTIILLLFADYYEFLTSSNAFSIY